MQIGQKDGSDEDGKFRAEAAMNPRARETRLDDPAGRKGKRLMAIRKTIGCGCHRLSRRLVQPPRENEKAGDASNRELSFEPSWEHGRQ